MRSGGLLAALLLLGLATPAEAGHVDLFGPSVRSAGLAGGGWALEDGAAALTVQPAALGLGERDDFRLHYIGGHVWLDSVSGLTRLDGLSRPSPYVSVQPSALSADFSKGITPWLRAGVHVSLSLPWLYSMETKDPWVPYSMRWQNRISRSIGTAGFSVRLPVRGLKQAEGYQSGGVWLGASLSIRPHGIIYVDLELEGVSGPEGGTVEATLPEVVLAGKYVIRPQLSILADLGVITEKLEGLRLALSYLPESTTNIDPIRLDVAVLGLGEVNAVFALIDRLEAQVALGVTDFYDPHEFHISLAVERPRFALSVDLRVGLWSQLGASYGRVVESEPSELVVTFGTGNSEVFPVVSGRFIGDGNFRDTVEVMLGGEGRIAVGSAPLVGTEIRLRGGLRYMQGVVRPNAGPLATLDGDALSASFGLGLVLPLKHSNARLGPLKVDWALQATRLLGQDLPKTTEGLSGVRNLPVRWEDGAEWSGGWALVSGVSVGIGF